MACVIAGEGWAQLKPVPPRTGTTGSVGSIGGGLGSGLGGIGTGGIGLGGTLPSVGGVPPPSTGRGDGAPPDETTGQGVPPVNVADYTDDILDAQSFAEYGTKSLIVLFHPDGRIRIQAMRDLLETTYKKLMMETAATAAALITGQKAAIKQQLAEVEDRLLSIFYWPTQSDLRRNIEEIRRVENEVGTLRSQAQDEARERAFAWARDPVPDWSTRGRIEISTGPAFQQLQAISIGGWSGF